MLRIKWRNYSLNPPKRKSIKKYNFLILMNNVDLLLLTLMNNSVGTFYIKTNISHFTSTYT